MEEKTGERQRKQDLLSEKELSTNVELVAFLNRQSVVVFAGNRLLQLLKVWKCYM